MKKKDDKNTFIVNCDWYTDFISDCTDKEKAFFLDAMFSYNIDGTMPETPDRFLSSNFKTMKRWFDANAEKYGKQKIDSKLNQDIRWAKAANDNERLKELEEKKQFLKTHTLREYTSVYERIPRNTSEYLYEYDNESVYDSVSDNESVYDSDNVFDSVNGNGDGGMGEAQSPGNDGRIYAVDDLKQWQEYIEKRDVDFIALKGWLFNNADGKKVIGKDIKTIIESHNKYAEKHSYKSSI